MCPWGASFFTSEPRKPPHHPLWDVGTWLRPEEIVGVGTEGGSAGPSCPRRPGPAGPSGLPGSGSPWWRRWEAVAPYRCLGCFLSWGKISRFSIGRLPESHCKVIEGTSLGVLVSGQRHRPSPLRHLRPLEPYFRSWSLQATTRLNPGSLTGWQFLYHLSKSGTRASAAPSVEWG